MITVYSKPNCVGCNEVKSLLELNNVPYEVVDIFEDMTAMETLVNLGLKSVPQIFKDGQHIGGLDKLKQII